MKATLQPLIPRNSEIIRNWTCVYRHFWIVFMC